MASFYRELQREKIWSRIHLVPLLMAEGDRAAHQLAQGALEAEKAIMDGVPKWEVRNSAEPLLSALDKLLMIITIAIRVCRLGVLVFEQPLLCMYHGGTGWQECVPQPQVQHMTCVYVWTMDMDGGFVEIMIYATRRQERAEDIHEEDNIPASYASESGVMLGPKRWTGGTERGSP